MTNPEPEERISTVLQKWFAGLVAFACVGTAISTWMKVDPGFIAPLVTVLVILCGASICALCIGKPFAIIGVLVFCGGAEVVGLFTGLPFGHYEYTSRWWPTIPIGDQHRFPLLLPFAWLLILGGAFRLARLRLSPWAAVPVCAFVTTLIDIPMERAMTDMFGYWKWQEMGPLFGAPIQNSVGWFVVSLFAASILALANTMSKDQSSINVLSMFCMFVAVTGFIHGFDWAWVMLASIAVAIGALQHQLKPA